MGHALFQCPVEIHPPVTSFLLESVICELQSMVQEIRKLQTSVGLLKESQIVLLLPKDKSIEQFLPNIDRVRRMRDALDEIANYDLTYIGQDERGELIGTIENLVELAQQALGIEK